MKELPIINNNESPNLCKGCGICCKTYSGWYMPHQVLDILENMKDGDLPKNIVIDCLDSCTKNGKLYPDIYVLRPAHTNSKGYFDYSYGGVCVNYSDENGCSLTFDKRPFSCQILKASEDKRCMSEWSKYDVADHWVDYQNIFYTFFEKYNKFK